MLSPKVKRNCYRILPFGIIWILSGWIFLIVELAATGGMSQLPETAIKMDYQIFILSSLAMAVVGILTGYIELKYLHNIFSGEKLIKRVFSKLFIYSLFFLIIVLVFFPIAASLELNTPIFDSIIWKKYLNYLTSITHFSTVIQLATALIISLFYSEISDFIGPRVLKNFFIGKYHIPLEEERIFMFLDMKSSTTIAEKLGHLKYFKLLREYYNCFTDAIIEHEGEIYQYVGDEIILSWRYQKKISSNRSIDCFMDMKKNLKNKEKWFKQQFGIVPTFKAGIHLGKVTTGEIGVLKKDILFSGDVLNVAARIQGLCNFYDVDLIISDDMLRQLNLGLNYKASLIGKEELKGKEEKIELYSLTKNNDLNYSNYKYSIKQS